jgi:hypothetical protein
VTDEVEERRLRGLKLLVDNQEVHAAHCAKIKTKSGKIVPLIWNQMQRHIHEALEDQVKRIGMVRALLLKYRQGGGSTYIGHRFYWKTSTRRGQNAFIVAHEDKATTNLYDMVKRFHKHNPIAPSTQASNAKELIFGELDGGYKLATAGTDDVGRSNTARLLHASEFAFWRNPEMHLAGIGNTIPDGADGQGSEIILESTANGQGNAFHRLWQEAEAGRGLFIPVFTPWFWHIEYRSALRSLELSPEDELYMRAYGLDLEQMQWRADKIASYGEGFEWLFDQEYPATPGLAFQSPTKNPLVNPNRVMAAVNSDFYERFGPLIVGCDPAGDGSGESDRTAIVFRRGRVVPRVEYHDKWDTMKTAGRLATIWRDEQPDAMFVDKSGMGAGIVDRLRELNIPVVGVNFAERANDSETYDNRRAEMWWLMKQWFEDAPVRLVRNAALIADITAPQPAENSSNGRKLLEKKKDMAKRGIRSPDGGDALALTFAAPVIARVDTLVGIRGSGDTGAATVAGY